MATSSPVNGNNNFSVVENTLVQGSSLNRGLEQLDINHTGIFQYPTTASGVTPGSQSVCNTITQANLNDAMFGGPTGLGLLLYPGTSLTILRLVYSTGDSTDDVNSSLIAAQLLSSLGLSQVGQARMLSFYYLDTPASADVQLYHALGSKVIVKRLNEDAAIFFQTSTVTNATAALGTVKIMASAENVTSGQETIRFDIIQTGCNW